MFRVIDTINVNATLFVHQPEWRERYGTEGLLAILDPAEVTEVPVAPGTLMRIHRPDGSTIEHITTYGERPSNAVGLYFPHLTANDLPRLSMLEAIPAPTNP